MTEAYEHSFEISPEVMQELTLAYGERLARDHYRQMEWANEFNGVVDLSEPLSPFARLGFIAQADFIIRKMDVAAVEPSEELIRQVRVELIESLDMLNAWQVAVDDINSQSLPGEELFTTQEVRDHFESLSAAGATLFDLENLQSSNENGTRKMFETALRMAEDKGVGVSAVFLDDELNLELQRATRTPEEDIRMHNSLIGAISRQGMIDMSTASLTMAVRQGLAGRGMSEAEIERELEQEIEELKADPEFDQDIDEMFHRVVEITKSVAIKEFELTWGSELLDMIPEELLPAAPSS